jgi:integrase
MVRWPGSCPRWTGWPCGGRRISEILLLDPDPLLPLAAGPAAAQEPGTMTARLRYQQTKIDGAPDTILVDDEVVAIIRAQQDWAAGWLAGHAAPGARPRYLFLGRLFNRNADRPYVSATLHKALTELARQLGIRDSTGRLADFQRTHRFRHTRATSLLNAGVPIHVVQRYLGPLTRDDHALRPDAGRNPRGRVPALPQADRRCP